MKRLLVFIGLWLAKLGGWEEIYDLSTPIPINLAEYSGIPQEVLDSAKLMISQTAKMEGSGEYKRREALRALMNRHPNIREKDLNLAIELAIRWI